MALDVLAPFPRTVQRMLGFFAFFIACPVLTIFNVSVTFYIFLLILLKVSRLTRPLIPIRAWYDVVLVAFPFVGLISLALAPETSRSPGIISDIQIWTQYVYWIAVLLFFKEYGGRIDWKGLLRCVFYGLSVLMAGFYFFPHELLNTYVLAVSFDFPRNAFVFQMLCLAPLCLYFLYKTYGKLAMCAYAAFYLFVMLLTEGRAGSILAFAQIAVSLILIVKPLRFALPLLLVGIGGCILFIEEFSLNAAQKEYISDVVRPYNDRLADLMEGTGEGDLSQDKSWLIRLLMVTKAKEISQEYPWFGIGLNRFTYFDTKLPALRDPEFSRLRSASTEFLNTRSSHNAYLQLLSETGYIGFISFLILLIVPAFFIFYRIFAFKMSNRLFLAIPFLSILVHFYAIASITGAVSWFIIGLAYYSVNK